MIGEGLHHRANAIGTRLDDFVVVRLIMALVREIISDDVFGTAAEMAYRFLFAVFPMLLFLISALGFVGRILGLDTRFDVLMNQAEPFLPPRVSQVLNQYVSSLFDSKSSAFLTIGLLGTVWGASGGVTTLVKGLNRAYDVQQPRPYLKRQGIALVTTLTVPAVAIGLFALTVLGRNLADWLGASLGLRDQATEVLVAARWPVLFILLFLSLSLVYHVLPNTGHRYVWSLPGSAVATVGWLLLTQAFGVYVANVGKYDATYGSFGIVMAFLLWLYFVGVVILLGAELNALLEPTEHKLWRPADVSKEPASEHPPSISR